jgi:hypothetical protein
VSSEAAYCSRCGAPLGRRLRWQQVLGGFCFVVLLLAVVTLFFRAELGVWFGEDAQVSSDGVAPDGETLTESPRVTDTGSRALPTAIPVPTVVPTDTPIPSETPSPTMPPTLTSTPAPSTTPTPTTSSTPTPALTPTLITSATPTTVLTDTPIAANTPTAGQVPSVYDDMADGLDGPWNVQGDYELVDGRLQAVTDLILIVGDETWTDYRVEVEVVTARSGRTRGNYLCMRCSDDYKVAAAFASTTTTFLYLFEGGQWRRESSFSVNANNKVVRGEVRGYRIEFWIGEQRVAAYLTDASSGWVEIRLRDGSSVSRISIEPLP